MIRPLRIWPCFLCVCFIFHIGYVCKKKILFFPESASVFVCVCVCVCVYLCLRLLLILSLYFVTDFATSNILIAYECYISTQLRATILYSFRNRGHRNRYIRPDTRGRQDKRLGALSQPLKLGPDSNTTLVVRICCAQTFNKSHC